MCGPGIFFAWQPHKLSRDPEIFLANGWPGHGLDGHGWRSQSSSVQSKALDNQLA